MLTILNVLPIISLILAIILMIIAYVISHYLIAKENARWRDYKSSNIIVEVFEMHDKGLLSADKDEDIERIKHEYSKQYEAYKDHKCFKDELINLMVKTGIFSFLSILLSGLFYAIKWAMM
jgi:chloramphenicol O-acetyltransferase